jgi:hypothetical protein
MRKRSVATWIVVGALATGAGVALADTSPPSPTVDSVTTTTVSDTSTTTVPGTTTTTVGETTTTVAPDTTTTVAPTTTTTAPGSDDGHEGTHPDNHGSEVSKAAHDHSHDAECGNHGHYVSAVAHGQATCAPGAEKSHGKGAGGGDESSDH